MSKEIVIRCLNLGGAYKKFPAGSSLLDILEALDLKSKYPIMAAKVNNKVEPLGYRAYGNKTIEFIGLETSIGMRTYVRSLCFVMAKAVDNILPKVQFNIEHPLSKGYFCKVWTEEPVTQELVDKIKAKMREYIKADLSFKAREEETDRVAELFREVGNIDKATLVETTGQLYSQYYELDGYIDYYYGCLVPSTGYLDIFELEILKDGLLLRIPNRNDPVKLEEYIPQPMLYQAYKDQLDFLAVLGLDNVGDLNRAIANNQISDVIKVAEALQERSIGKIAEDIVSKIEKDDVHIVLVSGPSSSGKTTFRMRMEVQLMINFIKPVGLSLDDYFVNRVDTPKDEKGDYDYESLYALDIKQFNEDLLRLLDGEEVHLPTYNFTTGEREYKEGKVLKLRKGDVLIIEGIHGLNPELTASVPDSKKYKIYISALTAISLDNHNWIPAADNRLLRRMIRDYRYRNYSPMDTISRWPSVRAGEEKWIFPYQENADAVFNSAMIYELAALRRYAEPILARVPNSAPEYAEAHRLLKFLSYFNYIQDRELPPTSLLREFLGGSSFSY